MGAIGEGSGAETAAQSDGTGAREKSVKITVWQDGAHEKRSTQHVVSMSEGRAADHERDAVTSETEHFEADRARDAVVAANVERGNGEAESAADIPGESDAVTVAGVSRGDGEREACVGHSAPLWPWARQRKHRPAHWGQFCETCPERRHEKHERADVSRGWDSSGEGRRWGLGAPAASVI